MEAEVKALQAQAQATQATLVQLQKREAGESPAWGLPSLPKLPAVDGLAGGVFAALALVLALSMVWRWRSARLSRPAPDVVQMPQKVAPESQWHTEADDSRFWTPPDAEAEVAVEPLPVPELVPEPVPVRTPLPERETPSTADDSVPPPSPSAVTFDLEAATSEVARVRKTLAERREARARQRAQDAQRLLEASLQADASALPIDLSLDFEEEPDQPLVASASPLSQPPFVNPVTPAEPDMELELEPAPEAILPMTQSLYPAPATKDVYAVKLALAQESEAIELWPEARELATEVLESSDADLQAQAHALLARIDQSTPVEPYMEIELELEPAPEAVLPMMEAPSPTPVVEDVYGVKLALALESEMIELWPEARELATEVLESSDADLQAQANALLARINQSEGEG